MRAGGQLLRGFVCPSTALRTRFNVTFQRLYRNDDGKWQGIVGFNRDDLLVLMKVADATHTRVTQLLGEKRAQRQSQSAA